jgi:DNA invertase Pin-like site-specific DNA recombinase
MAATASALIELPTLQPSRPVAGYVRVSRVGDRSGESYISPVVQRKAIEGWAASRGVELVLHEPEENVSGGTMDRPVFNRILAAIKAGEYGGIVVYKYDRFARDTEGGLRVSRELIAHGAIFASATEPQFDLTTADGKMMFTNSLVYSTYFRDRITESWRTSLTHAVGRGVHISPSIAYGYAKDEGKRLVPNEAAPYVTRAYQLRADEGWTFESIAAWLNENAPARLMREKGETVPRPFTARVVERMIRTRVYLGVAHWGSVENADAHPALVDQALWQRAQRRVQTYSKARQNPDVPLLHGIVRCAGCRFQMSQAINRSGGYVRPYYRCRVHRVSGTCEAAASIRADRDDGLEAYVENVVMRELERRRERGAFDDVDDSGAHAEAVTALDAAREDLAAIQSDTTAVRRLGAAWLGFVTPHVEAVERAEARVYELEATQGTEFHGITADAYAELSREDRADVLRHLIDAVMIRNTGGPRGPQSVPLNRDRVRILWHGQSPDDLPAANRASAVVPWEWPEDDPASGPRELAA